MDEFSNGYQPEDYHKSLADGDYRLKIKDITSGFAQSSGNPMLTIELSIEGATFTVNHYLVKIEYFNANTTKFFDCFKIPRGNFDYVRWMGRTGKGRLEKGKKGYMEIKYLIVPEDPAASKTSGPTPPAANQQAKPKAPSNQWPADEPDSYTPPEAPPEGFDDDNPGF